MKIIVGLGNPGKEYKDTKHNLGFEVLDVLAQEFEWKFEKMYQATIVRARKGKDDVLLVKPQTYMNNSGISVGKLMKNMKIELSDLIVIHDDITMELGTIKISVGSGAGKHNGVQSVIDSLGSENFTRIRLGIGRGDGILKDVVLSKFTKEEYEQITKLVQKASQAAIAVVENGVDFAMNTFNHK